MLGKMENFQLSTLEPKPPTVSGNQKLKLSQGIEWVIKKAYTTYQGVSQPCWLPIP